MSVQMAAPRAQRGDRHLVVPAALVLIVAITALRLAPLRVVLGATRWINQYMPRPASAHEALQTVRAVRRACGWWPGRAACLETSLTAAWLSALWGRSVTWCHGFQVQPYTFHAWVEADGAPVDEPSTTNILLRTVTISAPDRRSHL